MQDGIITDIVPGTADLQNYNIIDVGVSNAFAIYTATRRSAELAGIGHITGSIEKGKSADMLVISGNPLEDLRTLRYPEMVITRGTILNHPKIRKRKQVEAELDKFL